jgi:hypothetical protein
VSCSLPGAKASVKISPFAVISSSASGAGGGTFSDAFLSYDFVVTGGTPGDAVTVGFTTTITTSLTGTGSSFAQVVWDDAVADSQFDQCSSMDPAAIACVHGDGAFSGTLTFAALSGDVGHINLDVDASSGFGGSGKATIDPMMFVLFDLDGTYSLQISPDVANALPTAGGGVPEPAAWALMLTGFGLAGASLRRQRLRIAA